MNNPLHEALEPICATEQMKQSTCDFIHDEIAKRQRSSYPIMRYAAVCCVMVALLLAGFGGYGIYTTPVSYISVDVNPSVELGLNRLDRVVTVAAYNDDGEAVLQNLNLENKLYTTAIELLLSDSTFGEYLTGDSLLSFAVISDREETLRAGIQQCRGYAEANAECHSADPQLVEAAHHSGLSFGKYQAYLELAQYDDSITADDCKGLTMRQLRDMISSHEGDNDSCGSSNGHGHGGNGGHGYRGGRNQR